jgi:hypothetical protein
MILLKLINRQKRLKSKKINQLKALEGKTKSESASKKGVE